MVSDYRPWMLHAAVNGEVARTEERTREASAILLFACLYALSEQFGGHRVTPNVDELLRGDERARLLPPGLTEACA